MKPHGKSVLSKSKKSTYVCFGEVIRLGAGPVAVDVSAVPEAAVAAFTDLEVEGGRIDDLVALGERVRRVARGATRGSSSLDAVLRAVLRDTIRPWSGLPPGWTYDQDTKLWTAGGEITVATRLTQSAAAALEKVRVCKEQKVGKHRF